eukprot:12613644-Ditylum_brightwellii.AAC.1
MTINWDVYLFELKDRFWAVSGPKNVVIWCAITCWCDELLKIVGDRVKIVCKSAEKIVEV